MDFVFQGFQSTLPPWIYAILLLSAPLLVWWSYRHLKSIRTGYRILLAGMRSAVFIILLILLLNPFFRAEETVPENPEIMVFMDASSSAGITRNDYRGLESYRRVIRELGLEERSGVSLDYYAFDLSVRPLAGPDSLRTEGGETNLYNLYEVMRDRRREADAAILLTDGIFTRGRSPVFEAASSPFPLFTVALGDTSTQRDLLVENVVSNATGYLDTSQPVEVTLGTEGYGGETVPVELYSGSELLDRRSVRVEEGSNRHSLAFELHLRESGLRQFRVVVPPQSGEWTQQNNTRTFHVEVLDERQRMLSVAFEIHPDVRHLRSLLLGDENTRLRTRTWLGGNRFSGGAFRFEPDSLDLLLLHGYPGSGTPGEVIRELNALLSSVPVIYFNTPTGDLARLQAQLSAPLPLSARETQQAVPVSPLPALEPTAHPVMELPTVVYDRMPALRAPVGGLQTAAGATMLFESSYMGEATGQPLVAVAETGNLRSAMLTGYGWYRLSQSTERRDREFINELMMNLVSWTAARPDNRLLVVEPSRKSFPGSEPVVLNAYLRNESGSFESDASVRLTVEGEDMEERFYSMRRAGPGRYTLEIPSLPRGRYSFEAEASKGDRTIDTRQGEFSVSGSNSELIDTRRRDRLLRQMAGRSGGAFFAWDSLEGFWDTLDSRGVLQQNSRNRETLLFPYRYAGWFVTVILLLSGEWVLRKYLSLP